jgi:glycosyltransferase involved in cell wall biosynthesis
MLATHRALSTWEQAVDQYVVPSKYVRTKFIEGGFPAERITVKPHFLVSDRGIGRGLGGYALYVGRLSEEKGIPILLEAWQKLQRPIALKIAGDGPLAGLVREAAERESSIEWIGQLDPEAVFRFMSNATVLLVPSIWDEPFGMVAVEAMSCGLPVVASRLGALQELVIDGLNGRLVEARDSEALARAVEEATLDRARLAGMRKAARQIYEQRYTAHVAYQNLLDAYAAACRCQAKSFQDKDVLI